MKRLCIIALLAAGAVVSGCDRAEDVDGSNNANSRGRYQGIGTFSVGPLWAQMADIAEPKDPATARIADDEQIIVVVDSRTGEVRQCGNLSGYCVAMNPWAAGARQGAAPMKLSKHASDFDANADETSSAPVVTNMPENEPR